MVSKLKKHAKWNSYITSSLILLESNAKLHFFIVYLSISRIFLVGSTLTLSGAVGRIRIRPTCFFAVFQAFLVHFTLFSAQVFDFRLLRVHVK